MRKHISNGYTKQSSELGRFAKEKKPVIQPTPSMALLIERAWLTRDSPGLRMYQWQIPKQSRKVKRSLKKQQKVKLSTHNEKNNKKRTTMRNERIVTVC